jgi:hypothetical protein
MIARTAIAASVLGFGFLQDGDVGVGVFLERKRVRIPSDFEQTSLGAIVSGWCYSTFGFSYTGHTTGFVFSKANRN